MSNPQLDPEAEALREMKKGYELSTRLHTLLREIVPRGDGRLESAYKISKDVQQSFASALSILKPTTTTTTTSSANVSTNSNGNGHHVTRGVARFRSSDPLALEIRLPDTSASVDDYSRTSEAKVISPAAAAAAAVAAKVQDDSFNNSRKRDHLQTGTTISYETHDYETHDEGHQCKFVKEKKICKKETQRNHLYSWTTTTCTPFNDGHQWRKYGEKKISNTKMPRCYYRCTHKDDQGCPATKQVQQKDNEDPPTFVVTYNKQHTCKNIGLLISEQFVVEPPIRDPCQLSLS